MIKRFGFLLALLASVTLCWGQIGPIPGMGPLPFAAAASGCAAPVVTNIGTATIATGTTVSISGVTVPAGSLIVIVMDGAAGTISASDGHNTYSTAASASAGGATAAILFAANASLTSGTITVTDSGGGGLDMSAVYASNIATASPQDAAVTATKTTTGTLTSGTPAQAGELFVAGTVAAAASSPTMTQDTGHGWAFPPNAVSNTFSETLGGGTQVNSGTGTKIFNPSFSPTAVAQLTAIVGFKHC